MSALVLALALTAVDDARACTPLASGGYAVATGGGLVTPGGKLTALDGLPDTLVHAVVETKEGLWVGTEGGAALVVNGIVVKKIGSAPVHALAPAESGVWIGTWGAGLLHSDGRAVATRDHIAGMTLQDGTLWVASSEGVRRLEGSKLVSAGSGHAQAVAFAASRVLTGALEGVFAGTTSLASVDARGIAADKDDALVATYGSGLLSLRGAQARAVAGIPRFARAVAVKGDHRCVATTEGLFTDEGKGWHRAGSGTSLASGDVTTMAALGSRVAIGTFDHGAAIVEDGIVHPIAGLENEAVTASAWQGNTLWLGTAHGLLRVGGPRLTKADGLPSSIVRSILPIGDRVLVGTEEGAAFVDGTKVTPLEPKKKNPGIESPMHATWALARGPDGAIYLGTSTGLYVDRDGRFTRLSVASGELPDDWVTALAMRGDDVVVGTYSHGVVELAKGKSTKRGEGFVNPDGLAIIEGKLYASTMDGLFVDGVRMEKPTLGRDVTGVRAVGDQLWISSRRGISVLRK